MENPMSRAEERVVEQEFERLVQRVPEPDLSLRWLPERRSCTKKTRTNPPVLDTWYVSDPFSDVEDNSGAHEPRTKGTHGGRRANAGRKKKHLKDPIRDLEEGFAWFK